MPVSRENETAATRILCHVDSSTVEINDMIHELSAPVIQIEDRIYYPLEEICELLGLTTKRSGRVFSIYYKVFSQQKKADYAIYSVDLDSGKTAARRFDRGEISEQTAWEKFYEIDGIVYGTADFLRLTELFLDDSSVLLCMVGDEVSVENLAVGMPIELVYELWGDALLSVSEPWLEEENAEYLNRTYVLPSAELVTGELTDGSVEGEFVRSISITSSAFQTPWGISVGDSTEDVQRVYGDYNFGGDTDLPEENKGSFRAGWSRYFTFDFEDGVVTKIQMFSNVDNGLGIYHD